MKKILAQSTYRSAWVQYATCTSPARRMDLQAVMNFIQPDCYAAGRPAAWEAFAATLPGYVDYWAQVSKIVAGATAERVRR